MKPESRPGEPDAEEGQALHWLDGLAGRDGGDAAHAEGARVHAALQPLAATQMPPWAEIERRAGAPAVGAPGAVGTARAEAANQAWRRVAFGAAATVLLAVVLTFIPRPDADGPGLRGSGPVASGAVWRVAEPQRAAQSLAAELQGLGATVEVHPGSDAVLLQITAPTAAAPAVNRRLAELEAALDVQGRLRLSVVAP